MTSIIAIQSKFKGGKMNKHLVILGIAILIFTVGLSGCFEPPTTPKPKLEIECTVVETLNESNEKIGNEDGFVHADNVYSYKISGTIKDKGKEKVDKIKLTANFYDNNGDYLYSESVPSPISDLANNTYFILFFTKHNYTEIEKLDYDADITIFFAEYEMKYFSNVTNVAFEYEIL